MPRHITSAYVDVPGNPNTWEIVVWILPWPLAAYGGTTQEPREKVVAAYVLRTQPDGSCRFRSAAYYVRLGKPETLWEESEEADVQIPLAISQTAKRIIEGIAWLAQYDVAPMSSGQYVETW